MSTPTAKELVEHLWNSTRPSAPLELADRVEGAIKLCESVLPGSDRYAQELAKTILRVLDGGEP